MNGGRARGRYGLTLVTVMALSLIGLNACTDDKAPPGPSATTTPSTGITPTSTATPPAAPKAQPTPKSAEAFVKYFWDVYNYSYQTLDPSKLESVSKNECKFCQSAIKEINQFRASGTRIEGLTVHLVSAAAPPVENTMRIAVVTVVRQDRGRRVDSDGKAIRLTGLDETQSLTALQWKDQAWRVHGISIDSKPGTP